jgi:hypothetical protein
MRKALLILASLGLMIPLMGETYSGPPETCAPYQVARTYGLTADGNQVAAGTAGSGTVQEYSNGQSAIEPPNGFIPALASAQALATFHIPPGIQTWDKPLNSVPLTPPCSTPGWHNTYAQDSPIWSGRVVAYHTFTFKDVTARWVAPTYIYHCDYGSEASVWVGIGGDYAGSLLQAGTGTYANGGNNQRFWYETVSPSGIYDVYTVVTAPAVAAGDSTHVEVTYLPDFSEADFAFLNEGKSSTIVYPVANQYSAYNGQSGEFIVERPSPLYAKNFPDKAAYMRESTSTNDPFWNSEYIDGAASNAYATGTQYALTMRDPGQSNPSNDQTTVLGATTTQSNTWHDCGPTSNTTTQ